MATRSTITAKVGDMYHTIYCHYDGYTQDPGVGWMLKEHYNTDEKVQALLALGDLSTLAPSIDAPGGHTFDTPVEGHTIAYGRDRGEVGTEPARSFIMAQVVREHGQEFNYFWNGYIWLLIIDHYKPLVPMELKQYGTIDPTWPERYFDGDEK